MLRIAIAVIVELVVLIAYTEAVLHLSDMAMGWHWAIQFAFFAVAGVAWVIPTRWIMLWSVRKHR